MWDPRPLLTTYNERQIFRTYYQFTDVDIDRYEVDGQKTQAMVSARELEFQSLPPESQTWVNLELLQAGVDTYGIDISEEMLDVLKRKAANAGLTPNVWQADMTDFTPQREYALVIVPFRTFLHNITVADQQAALQNFHRALGSDGRLALNFFVPSFEVICESYGEPKTRTFTQDGKEYVVTDVTDIENETEQIVKAERTVKHDDEVLQEATFRLTLISKTEFELLLETTGWRNWTGYGGFEREPLDDGPKRWSGSLKSEHQPCPATTHCKIHAVYLARLLKPISERGFQQSFVSASS